MMVLIGGGYSTTLAATQTMMQIWVHEAVRGRMMSFYSLVFLGVPPIGSLIAGIATVRFQAPLTLAVGGLLCVAGALYCACTEELQDGVAPVSG
jgi:predicted MFS family arabinose efflux permease